MPEEVFLQENAGDGNAPLVTVAMPVFNAGEYLRLAVLSIVRQTFTDWELLIIDDGSTDNALQDIADISDSRIRVLRDGANRGLAARLNEAIDLARGRYLARMDQDDVSYPDRFARQIEALRNGTTLDLVAVRAVTISDDNKVSRIFPCALSHKEFCARPWMGFYLPHPTWMGKIEWFRKYRYTVPGPYFCEDQELLLRSYRESRFGMVDEILFAYRVRSRINWRKLFKTQQTMLRIQLRHFIGARRLGFALLAISAFIGRIVRDLFAALRQILYQTRQVPAAADSAVSSQWCEVLKGLTERPVRVD